MLQVATEGLGACLTNTLVSAENHTIDHPQLSCEVLSWASAETESKHSLPKSVVEGSLPLVASLIGQEIQVGHEQISGGEKSYSS